MQVALPAPPAAPAAVPLKLDEPPPAMEKPVAASKTLTRPESTRKTRSWQNEIRQQLEKQQRRGEFYPPEAIAQGLEGEVLVLMVLNENGQVMAARIEQSSGHRLLDEAALRAIRALSSLPADTPQDVVLPVRFRLR
jgi:protein TonB